MPRALLLTSSFYGTRLPGDPRGFVSRVRDARADDPPAPTRLIHNVHGTPCDADVPGLTRAAREQMRGAPVLLDSAAAEVLVSQFHETARVREWQLLAAAVMANHVHLVVVVPSSADPTKVLGDFKAYGARALTARFERPQSGTWWTYGGSKRPLRDDRAVSDAIEYVVRRQHGALSTYDASENSGE